MRLEEFRVRERNSESVSQICTMPTVQYAKAGEQKIKIPMYSKEYDCSFDKISWKGLDPWTYDRVMEQEMKRLKNPVPDDDEDQE